jgi:hypothetical protein
MRSAGARVVTPRYDTVAYDQNGPDCRIWTGVSRAFVRFGQRRAHEPFIVAYYFHRKTNILQRVGDPKLFCYQLGVLGGRIFGKICPTFGLPYLRRTETYWIACRRLFERLISHKQLFSIDLREGKLR